MTTAMKRIDGGIEKETDPGSRRSIIGFGTSLRRLQDGRDFFLRIGTDFQELGDDGVGVEADGLRVGAQVRAAEYSARPLRDVVSFQSLEQRELDLCPFGDRAERDLVSLTHRPKASTET
jgi:hypothetical protein